MPIELDPPDQVVWRQALGSAFSPSAVARLRPLMTEFATWAIDQRIESGSIDFVMDLGAVVPTLVTLHLLGAPLSRWPTYAEMTHKVNYATGAERDDTFRMWDSMLTEIGEIAERRRSHPENDLITLMTKMRIDGRSLTTDEVLAACGTLVAGGIDTTAAAVSSTLKILGEDLSLRDRLAADRQLLPTAVEEFIRYVSPITGLARTATRDTQLGGSEIRAGDRLLLLFHGANMDENQFPEPHAIRVDRPDNKHVAFGQGPHRCIGAGIARADIPIMIGQVLDRMPDYELVQGAAVRYPSIGVSNNYISLPATFTPGTKVGVRQDLEVELTTSSPR